MHRNLDHLYGDDRRLLAISTKIKAYHSVLPSKNTDIQAKRDDLLYNLSPLIGDIIFQCDYQPMGISDVLGIIGDFNASENTSFDFEHFRGKGWLRLINEEVRIPGLIASHIRRHLNDDIKNKPLTPQGMETELACLGEVWKVIDKNRQLTLSAEELLRVLAGHDRRVDIDFLLEAKIIEIIDDNLYRLNTHHLSAQFSDKIIACLWFRFGGREMAQDNFRKFIRIIALTELWTHNIEDYLPIEDLKDLHTRSLELIRSQSDLTDNTLEWTHEILDSQYLHGEIDQPVPEIPISEDSYYQTLKEIRYHSSYYHDLCLLQGSRLDYVILLKFIIEYDFSTVPYETVAELMREKKNFYVRFKLFDLIGRVYPEIIPYLLNHQDLISTAFLCLEDFSVNTHFRKEDNWTEWTGQEMKIKNEIWLDMFEVVHRKISGSYTPEVYGPALAELLDRLAYTVFSFAPHNRSVAHLEHKMTKERYDLVIERLESLQHYSATPYLLHYLLPVVYRTFSAIPEMPPYNEIIVIPAAKIDMLTRLLQLTDRALNDEEADQVLKNALQTLQNDIIGEIYRRLEYFFTTDKIKVYRNKDGILMKTKVAVQQLGIEIIDWDYIFLWFGQKGVIIKLDDMFGGAITIDTEGERYSEANYSHAERIKTYLKIMMFAFTRLQRQKDYAGSWDFNITETLAVLRPLISKCAVKYSLDKTDQSRIDVFSDHYDWINGNNPYYKPLTTLLYESLNYFPLDQATEFFTLFFKESKELDRMLSAMNIIENNYIRKVLAEQIRKVDIRDYIRSRFSVGQLEQALINAVNSADFFDLAEPLMEKIESHIGNRKTQSVEKKDLLYRVKLLLALKRRDMKALESIRIPRDNFFGVRREKSNIKDFYRALHVLENEKKPDEAVGELQRLLSDSPDNLQYAFYLYQARVFKMKGNRREELIKAMNEFRSVLERNSDSLQENWNEEMYENVRSLDLVVYANTEAYLQFDQLFSTLPFKYLYRLQMVPVIYNTYLRRGMEETAFAFLNKARDYYRENDIELPEDIEYLIEKAPDDKLIEKLRIAVGEVRNLSFTNIPKVLPQVINGKKNVSEFILSEILSGLRLMRKKIKAIETIIHEDNFNDVFLATIRLRLEVWGWSIHDQERTGPSGTGRNTGRVDILIKSGGTDIALIEALKMKGVNFPELNAHILKSIEYVRDLEYYYILVYYNGKRDKFGDFFDSYQADVKQIKFPENWTLDGGKGFITLDSAFENTENFHIAKTLHGEKQYELYHIVVDLSSDN